MRRVIVFISVFCLAISAFGQNRGDPKKYSTTPGNPLCKFFDGFADNGDGTVSDPRSGLVWKRCPEGFNWSGSRCSGDGESSDWAGAMRAAKNSRFLGKSDWRLPSKEEFISILGVPRSEAGEDKCTANKSDRGQYAASKMIAFNLNGSKEADTLPGVFWSFSPSGTGDVRGVFAGYFGRGEVSHVTLRSDLYIRLVRGGYSANESEKFNREFGKHVDPVIMETVEKRDRSRTKAVENFDENICVAAYLRFWNEEVEGGARAYCQSSSTRKDNRYWSCMLAKANAGARGGEGMGSASASCQY